ncbi:MAG: GntR family transcriptional regulator [Verrucomicrobiae bacterium]|nr:GntR family transcriptional regulator [Verrucomicrobiae bacterium]
MKTQFTLQSADPSDVQIERFLRAQIENGELKVGDRLPNTGDLVREWRVGFNTVNKVMRRLVSEGLLSRNRKRGTYVNSVQKQVLIAVLVAPGLTDETAHFYRALLRAIRLRGRERRWLCRAYDGLNEFRAVSGFDHQAACQYLRGDLRHYAFKGFVDLHSGWVRVAETHENVPVARLGPTLAGAPYEVILDFHRFGKESLRFLAGKGLRKIAYIRFGDPDFDDTMDLEGIRDEGRLLELPEVEIHQNRYPLSRRETLERQAAEQTEKLLSVWRQRKEWPDALLVSDDIAARGVTGALLNSGGEEVRRLTVMVKTNEGIDHFYGMPVVRYDFSVQAVADALLDVLNARIQGETPPPLPVKIGGAIVAPPQ